MQWGESKKGEKKKKGKKRGKKRKRSEEERRLWKGREEERKEREEGRQRARWLDGSSLSPDFGTDPGWAGQELLTSHGPHRTGLDGFQCVDRTRFGVRHR